MRSVPGPAISAVALLAVIGASCGGQRPELLAAADPLPTATAVVEIAAPTPEPNEVPVPTATPEPPPTPTAVPAATPPPPPTATPTPPPTATPTPSPTPIPVPLVVHEQSYGALGTANGVALSFPAARVQYVGFHESGHDGAQAIDLLDGAVQSSVMEPRGRDTHPRGVADVVVDPEVEIRSPVTGTVISATTYVLYCEYSDDLVFIEPDERPGWQVKVFHIDGFQVAPGQRVEAGVTVLAPRATVLPFESQVDELTAEPSWPHVHIEVIDPSIPDRPSEGGGC